LKDKINEIIKTKYFLSLFLLLVSIPVLINFNNPACKIYASDSASIDYCYRFDVVVENKTGSTLNNYPVRLGNIPSSYFISEGYLEPQVWDLKPYVSTLTNEVEIYAQDIDENPATWWVNIPELPSGEKRTIRVLMGSPEQKRNQGITFNGGNEYTSIPDHNSLDLNHNLKLVTEIEKLNTEIETGVLIDKYDELTSTGYKLDMYGFGGNQFIKFTVDNETVNLIYNSSWTGNREIIAENTGTALTLYETGSGTSASNVVTVLATANTQDVIGGLGFNNLVVRNTRFIDTSTQNILAEYLYNPSESTETDTANYNGTIEDISGNSHVMNYYFDRPQTNITAVQSEVFSTGEISSATISDTTYNLMSGLGITYESLTPNNSMFGMSFLTPPSSNYAVPDNLHYIIILSVIGLLLAIGTYLAINNSVAALCMFNAPFCIGYANGITPLWIVFAVALAVIILWGSQQWAERT
tara:strand:+ start:3883 stop:5289 length:1407 start_codon:yes stop_codon:yes gene_type:complete